MGLSLSNFQFHGKELMDATDIDMGYNIASEVAQYCTVKTGVTCDTVMGYYYPTGDVGVQLTGCSDSLTWNNTPVSITIKPKMWGFRNDQCAVDFLGNAQSPALRSGMPTTNATGSALMKMISQMIIQDLRLGLWRWTFFNDTTESTVGSSSGGKHIVSGFAANMITWVDSIWSKGKELNTPDVTFNATVNPDNTYTTFCDLVLPTSSDAAYKTATIKAQSGVQILCTKTVYNLLTRYFHGKNADTGYIRILQDNTLTFDGVPVIGLPQWDYWLQRAYGGNWNPHRILFTPKSNLIMAMNNNSVFDNLYGQYDALSRKMSYVTDGLFDALVAQPNFIRTSFSSTYTASDTPHFTDPRSDQYKEYVSSTADLMHIPDVSAFKNFAEFKKYVDSNRETLRTVGVIDFPQI